MAGSLKTSEDTTAMDVSALQWLTAIRQGRDLMDVIDDDDIQGHTQDESLFSGNLREMKSEGCDAIRLSVCWDAHLCDSVRHTIDPSWFDHVQRTVDECLRMNMKVILNMGQTEMACDYTHQERYNKILTDLWRQIAIRFRNYDGRLAFSGIDEIQRADGGTPTEENIAVTDSYNQTFVSAVRGTGGRNVYRNLIIQPFAASIGYGISFLHIPLDATPGRIAIEFHNDDTNMQLTESVLDRIEQLWTDKGYGVILCSDNQDIIRSAQNRNITVFLRRE